MKLGIIGVGVVGSAVKQAFEEHYDIVCYDKFKKEYQEFSSILSSDLIFVCVPTLTNADGTQELEPLESTCNMLWERGYQGVVINKCTVVPGTTNRLSQKFPGLKLIHYPEFLTEANALQDFLDQKFIILGGLAAIEQSTAAEIFQVFYKLNPFMHIKVYLDPTSTEMVKYTHNTFLATKVEFFNEVYDLCQKLGISYHSLLEGIHLPGKVGSNHTAVPGPDGKRGFGGMCFPKDTKALVHFTKLLGVDMPVLQAAVEANCFRRDDV